MGRVSKLLPSLDTPSQDLSNRVAPLAAVLHAAIFREKIYPVKTERPECEKVLLRRAIGDIVVPQAADRRSRDSPDVPVIARDVQRAGAGVNSWAEPT
jgi:hypothetical protein